MTPEKLRRHALSKGASVSIGDEHFNSGRERVPVRPSAPAVAAPAPKAPEPAVAEPAVAERAAPVDLTPLVRAITESQEALARTLAQPRQEAPAPDDTATRALERLAKVLAAPRPRCSWRFEIERDGNNLISSIVATPIPS